MKITQNTFTKSTKGNPLALPQLSWSAAKAKGLLYLNLQIISKSISLFYFQIILKRSSRLKTIYLDQFISQLRITKIGDNNLSFWIKKNISRYS